MSVSEIMMRRFSAVASVVESDDLRTVADKLALHGIGAVVVLSEAGRLAGMISDGDLVKALSARRDAFDSLSARDIMNGEVCTCRPDETELEILKVMIARNIRHMAVMMGENVIGLVTIEEVVKQRLEKIGHLTNTAARQPDPAARLAMLDRHLKENLGIFGLFRAVNAVQEETGLAEIDARARQILWVIGEAEAAGTPLQVRDLMVGRKWGTYPTVRRHVGELEKKGLVLHILAGDAAGSRGRRFVLSPRGREVFQRMDSAVTGSLQSTGT